MSEPIRAPATAGSVVPSNTIIGGNTGGTNPDCAGKLADGPGGHNLIGSIGTGTATGACSGPANGVNRAAAPTAAQISTHTG